ncbi:MAG: alpha/beta fold hydrolase [Bacteroidota bacterium]
MKFNYCLLTPFIILLLNLPSIAQKKTQPFLPGDALPDAPELAARGEYKVGVRTLKFVNKDQIDILNSKDGSDLLYDRPLTVEVWYPAKLSDEVEELVTYDEVMGTANNPMRPVIPFTFQGRAARDAAPLVSDTSYPLIIVSHGYVGSRFLMTYLTENLASKGYIVVAIDHKESTFRDAAPFPSTLLNRSKDVLFILDQMAESKHFLSQLIDADNTALIGYSMGGYGVLNVAGAGYSDQAVQLFGGMTGGSNALAVRGISNEDYQSSIDPRIKAVVAFAPWGMKQKVWDSEGLKGLKIPTFFVAGSQDDVSGYEDGIKAIYEGSVNVDRYLLTYRNARHNVAPNPPPTASLQPGLHFDEYYRYAEPSWNEKRINNINQHFVTAFLGIHLKQMDYGKYLKVQPNSNEKNWTGFKPRSSTGLELLHGEKVE